MLYCRASCLVLLERYCHVTPAQRIDRRHRPPRRPSRHTGRLGRAQDREGQTGLHPPARWQRHDPVRDLQEECGRGGVRRSAEPDPGKLLPHHRLRPRRRPRARRLRTRCERHRGCPHHRRLPDQPQGARHRVPDGAPAPVGALIQAARAAAHARRGDRRRPGMAQRPGLHPLRHADPDAGGRRGHLKPVRDRSTSTSARPTWPRPASSTSRPG